MNRSGTLLGILTGDYIGQLKPESRTGYSGSYTYNATGNRLTRTVNSVTEDYSYDDADKLQDVKISSVTQKSYGYDAAGRTTSVVTGAGTTTLAYDYEGRISTITYPSTATNTFTYNGLDTRVGKVDSAGTSTYKRDGAGVTAPVLNDGAATYTPGISERRSSTTTFLHSGLKNADSQTGTGQTIATTKLYDAFGNVLSSTGTWKGPFGYAGSFGYQEDADSSLKLLGHRYYDASIGRFLTRDRIKDGQNWYAYCENDPIGSVDVDGLQVGKLLKEVFGKKSTAPRGGKIGRGLRVTIPRETIKHIKERHFAAVPKFPGKSKFPEGIAWRDLIRLIDDVVQRGKLVPNHTKNLAFEGRFDGFTGWIPPSRTNRRWVKGK